MCGSFTSSATCDPGKGCEWYSQGAQSWSCGCENNGCSFCSVMPVHLWALDDTAVDTGSGTGASGHVAMTLQSGAQFIEGGGVQLQRRSQSYLKLGSFEFTTGSPPEFSFSVWMKATTYQYLFRILHLQGQDGDDEPLIFGPRRHTRKHMCENAEQVRHQNIETIANDIPCPKRSRVTTQSRSLKCRVSKDTNHTITNCISSTSKYVGI